MKNTMKIQKLVGIGMLALSALIAVVAPILLDGDGTALLIAVPAGLACTFSKKQILDI